MFGLGFHISAFFSSLSYVSVSIFNCGNWHILLCVYKIAILGYFLFYSRKIIMDDLFKYYVL